MPLSHVTCDNESLAQGYFLLAKDGPGRRSRHLIRGSPGGPSSSLPLVTVSPSRPVGRVRLCPASHAPLRAFRAPFRSPIAGAEPPLHLPVAGSLSPRPFLYLSSSFFLFCCRCDVSLACGRFAFSLLLYFLPSFFSFFAFFSVADATCTVNVRL